jgi:pyrroloquinoline quinone (PQQ) biosynthesis protein C
MSTFGEDLSRLRARSLRRVRETPLVRAVLAGDAPRTAYARYLLDVQQYAQHSPVVIALAGARAAAAHPEAARYLIRHAGEELGHDAWARADLAALGVSPEEIQAARPSPPCMSMIGLEYYWAGHGNAVALLGWTFTLEALGDDVGRLAATALARANPTGARATTFLAGHGEADHDHIRDIVAVIEEHVTAPQDRADLMFVATLSADLYAEMLERAWEGGR